jgi:lipooligosaccharide transport system ATP-binding protein
VKPDLRDRLADALLKRGDRERIEALADRVLVYTDEGDAVANAVAHDGFETSSVLVRRASLEDVFLILTGRSLED